VSYGCLAARKTVQGSRRQARTIGALRGNQPAAELAAARVGGGLAIGLRSRGGKRFVGALAYVPLVHRPRWGKRRTRVDAACYPGRRIPRPNLGRVCVAAGCLDHYASGRWAQFQTETEVVRVRWAAGDALRTEVEILYYCGRPKMSENCQIQKILKLCKIYVT
jgi:hypothetical protein